ncbi:MAG: hypothetical protein AABY07_07855 [Nanoarchaeota archaeon]
MRKILTMRVWVLIIAIVLAVLAINPNPWAKGIEIKSVREGSEVSSYNIKSNEKLISVNNIRADTIQQYNEEISKLQFSPVNIKLTTSEGTFEYSNTGDLGFIQENLTIVSLYE